MPKWPLHSQILSGVRFMTLHSFPISSTKLFTLCTNSSRSPELHVYRNIPHWIRISQKAKLMWQESCWDLPSD